MRVLDKMSLEDYQFGDISKGILSKLAGKAPEDCASRANACPPRAVLYPNVLSENDHSPMSSFMWSLLVRRLARTQTNLATSHDRCGRLSSTRKRCNLRRPGGRVARVPGSHCQASESISCPGEASALRAIAHRRQECSRLSSLV